MNRQQITEAVARGWCHPKNAHKTMDEDLALAIVREVYEADTMPNLGLASTRELLAELTARIDVCGCLDYRTVGGRPA